MSRRGGASTSTDREWGVMHARERERDGDGDGDWWRNRHEGFGAEEGESKRNRVKWAGGREEGDTFFSFQF